MSALKRLNYDLFYFVNDENKSKSIDIYSQIYDKLFVYISNLKKYKEIRSKLKDTLRSEDEKRELEEEKKALEDSDNIFIDIETKLKESFKDKIGGISFYITDRDKNITPLSKHVFRPIKRYEISLVIYKKDTSVNERNMSIISKEKGLFKKRRLNVIAKPSQKPAKVPKQSASQKPAKPAKPAKPDKPVKVPKSLPTRTQPTRSAKRGGSLVRVGQDPNILFKKNIFSFNICHDPKFNPQSINHMLINPNSKLNPLHYLTEEGLYILYQQHVKNIYIYEGEYNTSSIRERIFNKISLLPKTDIEKKNKLSMIAWSYYTCFYKSIYYNEKVFIKLLDNFLKLTEIGEHVNNLEIEIIEKFRPYINGCIININNQLQAIPEFNNDIGIFVVGGDSIRRYKNDITQTKDIDTKIHVPLQYQTDENIKKILLVLLENMFNLCAYFIIFKQHIFEEQIKKYQFRYGLIQYNLEFILYNTDPVKDFSNFKFRQTYKDKFPVDLFSLDYKCEAVLTITESGNVIKLPFDYEISFLDIVIEMLADNQSYYKKKAALSNNLPVSTLDFLIEDLTKTYNSIKSSSSRFLSGKIFKDHIRYDELIKLKSLPENIKPFIIIKESDSIIPKIIDNHTLSQSDYEVLKRQREILDNILIVPTETDKSNIKLFKDYKELVDFFETYYDFTDVKYSKVLMSYKINEMKEELIQPKAKSRAKTTKGGLGIFDHKSDNSGYIGFDKGNKGRLQFVMPKIQELSISEKKKTDLTKYDEGLLNNELLKSLVICNNLSRSYALYIDLTEYDDLYINCEAEILANAEFIITNDDIIENENINQESIRKYKHNFYNKVNEFLKLSGIKTLPKFNPNQDLYEINWNGNKDNNRYINILRNKIIDKYGGSSFYYELE